MSEDRKHIRRIRQAMHRLMQARNYARQAAKLVREAERDLQSAITAATTEPPSGHDGERRAA